MEKMNKKYFGIIMISVAVLTGCSDKKEAKRMEPIKVMVETVKEAPVYGGQSYSGTIEEQSGSTLSFTCGGTINNIAVAEGQMVGKGQLIATVDPTSVRNAYDASLATRQQAEDAYRRMKQLHDNGSMPEIQWIEVQSKLRQAVSSEQIARKGLRDCHLNAPICGYVSQKTAEVGQNIMPGAPVVKLVNIDQVKVKISVPEEEIIKLRRGQTVNINVSALGNRWYVGKVAEIGVSADPLSRSYEVKALVSNGGHQLLPGMVCDVYAGAAKVNKAITLSAEIIQIDRDNRNFVWTAVGGKAHKVYIKIGENAGDAVIILSGLTNGDNVIVSGQQKVSEGMKITAGK